MNEVLARVHKRICSTVLCFCTVIPEIYAKANRKKKLKADWQNDVTEWEEKNADNPKMTELKAYKMMLDRAKKQRSL